MSHLSQATGKFIGTFIGTLGRLERCVLVASLPAVAGLLVALALTCQQQVERGERLRAEMRSPPALVLADAMPFAR